MPLAVTRCGGEPPAGDEAPPIDPPTDPPADPPLWAGGCAPGEHPASEGQGCVAAGIPPEACGAGFAPDGDRGCLAVLPDEPCPPGTMAVPGETSCREVAPCPPDRYGELPDEPGIEHVDGAYAGTDSDGSAERPWTTIQKGIQAAASGAIVAIAEGTYVENVLVQWKPVRLWGRCPSKVEIVGKQFAAIRVLHKTSGAEVRRLSARSQGSDVLGMACRGARM